MHGSPPKGLRARLVALDLHPKLERDFAVRTKTGAAASIVAVLLSGALFWGELRAYLALEKAEFMEVDPLRGDTMRINFDLTFPSMSCAGEGRRGSAVGGRGEARVGESRRAGRGGGELEAQHIADWVGLWRDGIVRAAFTAASGVVSARMPLAAHLDSQPPPGRLFPQLCHWTPWMSAVRIRWS